MANNNNFNFNFIGSGNVGSGSTLTPEERHQQIMQEFDEETTAFKKKRARVVEFEFDDPATVRRIVGLANGILGDLNKHWFSCTFNALNTGMILRRNEAVSNPLEKLPQKCLIGLHDSVSQEAFIEFSREVTMIRLGG